MPDLTCPTCADPLATHEAGNCLEEWAHQLGAPCAPCSRSIHDAWELVEALITAGYEVSVCGLPACQNPERDRYRVRVSDNRMPADKRRHEWSWGDSAPLTITRAYIRARSKEEQA